MRRNARGRAVSRSHGVRTGRGAHLRRALLRVLYVGNILMLLGLFSHQVYLHLADPARESIHTLQVERIREGLEGRSDFRFAVLGDIENSILAFGRQIVPRLNAEGYDFIVSAGNAVSGGQEESYRTLHGLLGGLDMPYLITFGENEQSDFGSYRYYEQFGPHFFSFVAGDTHFIFLDGTGKSSMAWQVNWLERELATSQARHRLVFIGKPVHPAVPATPAFETDNYLVDAKARERLRRTFSHFGVDAVFSANLTLFSRLQIDGVRYVTTGGAGEMIIDNASSYPHFVDVQVTADTIAIHPVPLDFNLPGWQRMLYGAWGAVYSFLYVGYLRFLLVVSGLVLLGVYLNRLIFRERNYYPDYDADPTPYLEKRFRVAMYTNNYFPFISGVTVSVDRLCRGLRALGDSVMVFAPTYGDSCSDDPQTVTRVPTLLAFGENREFRLSNIFLPRLRHRLKSFRPDIIHVHHPFWLGRLGLWMGRMINVPVVYTYHTRLEQYAHFVPLPGRLFRNLISHSLIRRFANRCQGVVVPTHATEEYLRLIGVTATTLIQPTGVDVAAYRQADPARVGALRREYGIRDSDIVLVSVSRISREKNIDFILRALARLHSADGPRFRLLLAGNGPDMDETRERIAALDLTETVTLTGAIPPEDMPHIYHLGDIFVFASKSETQGMVILEAMSAGLPVVAVRSSGIDDVVRDGRTGFKTPENIDVWTAKLYDLMVDDALRDRLGKEAASFAEDHDISAFARRIHEFYAFLMAQHRQDRQSGGPVDEQ